MPIAQLIGGRLVNTMKLAGITTLVSVPLALTLGITAAMMRGSVYDRIVTVLTIGVISVPEFMIATSAVLSLPFISNGCRRCPLSTRSIH